jgi:hypothetical protein
MRLVVHFSIRKTRGATWSSASSAAGSGKEIQTILSTGWVSLSKSCTSMPDVSCSVRQTSPGDFDQSNMLRDATRSGSLGRRELSVQPTAGNRYFWTVGTSSCDSVGQDPAPNRPTPTPHPSLLNESIPISALRALLWAVSSQPPHRRPPPPCRRRRIHPDAAAAAAVARAAAAAAAATARDPSPGPRHAPHHPNPLPPSVLSLPSLGPHLQQCPAAPTPGPTGPARRPRRRASISPHLEAHGSLRKAVQPSHVRQDGRRRRPGGPSQGQIFSRINGRISQDMHWILKGWVVALGTWITMDKCVDISVEIKGYVIG